MSSTKVKAEVIEVDIQVVENERVWNYLEPSEEYLFSPRRGRMKE
jgi:hypothetical protein